MEGFWGQVHWRAPICCAGSAINGAMPLHLIKLAVGAEALADSREWTAELMTETERPRAPAY
jgi:hypothetical protein